MKTQYIANDGKVFHNEKECIEYEDQQAKVFTPIEIAAIYLHHEFCTHNHTDGCGWYYYNIKNNPQIQEWINRIDYYRNIGSVLERIINTGFIPQEVLKEINPKTN